MERNCNRWASSAAAHTLSATRLLPNAWKENGIGSSSFSGYLIDRSLQRTALLSNPSQAAAHGSLLFLQILSVNITASIKCELRFFRTASGTKRLAQQIVNRGFIGI